MTTKCPELTYPLTARAIIGAAFLTGFLLFFVFLAVFNLFNWTGVIPSILWLFLVIGICFGFCKELGIKHVLIEILGAFTRKHSARTLYSHEGRTAVEFGYQIFGHRLAYLKIPVVKIESVSWSAGQATHMSGRDCNDWSVAVRYDHDDPLKSQKQKNFPNPDQEVYIVGISNGHKADVAVFGHAFLDYLRESGVSLMQGKDNCTFVRPTDA